MSQIMSTLVVVGLFAAVGCAGKPSPATAPTGHSSGPASGAATTATQDREAPSSSAAGSSSAASSSSESAGVASLRSLAARLVESDGRGGWRINEQAATELEKQGPEGLGQLWTLLKDSQVEVRRGAAFYLLGQLDSADSNQAAAFSELLEDSDRTVRGFALSAIKDFRKAGQLAALPRLAAMLDPGREDKPENRAAAARLCGSLRAEAGAAATGLQSAASSDPDAKVRAAAVAALVQVALPAEAVPTLAKALKDQDPSVRLVSAARLRQLGLAASPAADELASALGDNDSGVSEAAAEALLRIGASAVKPLVAQLGAGNVAARKLALACLAKLGPAAKPAAPAIEKCRQDSDPQVRQLAEVAIKRVAGQ